MSDSFEVTCRLCSKTACDKNSTKLMDEPILIKKIDKLFNIAITEWDQLPKLICISCHDRLEDSFSFYVCVCATDKKLKEILSTTSYNKNETSSALNNTFTCDSDREVAQSKRNAKEIICPHCNKVFSSKSDLRSHVKEFHPNDMSKRQYQCRFCLLQFETQHLRAIHQVVHNKDKPFLCESCGKTFKHSSNLRIHLNTHSTVRKKFPCDMCSKSFLTRGFLKDHQNIHYGKTPYRCDVCCKSFHGRFHLRQHKWTHSARLFQCSFCQQTFTRKGNMAAHVKCIHLKEKQNVPVDVTCTTSVKNSPIPTSEQLHKEEIPHCKRCKKDFESSHELKHHSSTVHLDVTECNICGKLFKHHGSLTYHRRVAHTGERPFKCSYCDQAFLLQSVLTVHIRKKHTGECPFQCEQCSRAFHSAAALREHSLSHSDQKTFICEICGRGFRRNKALSVHLKSHSGVRDHVCSTCGKSFVQKHVLLKHRKIRHPDSMPFFCKFCGDSFAKKTDALKHESCRRRALHRADGEDLPSSSEKILDLAQHENPI